MNWFFSLFEKAAVPGSDRRSEAEKGRGSGNGIVSKELFRGISILSREIRIPYGDFVTQIRFQRGSE
jgi:hypothetical protein